MAIQKLDISYKTESTYIFLCVCISCKTKLVRVSCASVARLPWTTVQVPVLYSNNCIVQVQYYKNRHGTVPGTSTKYQYCTSTL